MDHEAKLNKLQDEAYAKIIWGEPPAEVTSWLIDKGVTDYAAKQIVRESVADRNAEIRKSGIKHLIVGLLVLIPSLLITVSLYSGTSRPGRAVGIVFLGVLFGFFKVGKGIERFVFARASGSISSMD